LESFVAEKEVKVRSKDTVASLLERYDRCSLFSLLLLSNDCFALRRVTPSALDGVVSAAHRPCLLFELITETKRRAVAERERVRQQRLQEETEKKRAEEENRRLPSRGAVLLFPSHLRLLAELKSA
jgi:hypothetical protein